MEQLSDLELVNRAQKGNREAVGALYDRHHLRIYRYVRSRIYDTQLAHDLTGEIFLRMVSHLDTYRPTGAPFTAWLYQIARNHLANHVQKTSGPQMVALTEMSKNGHTAVDPAAVVEQQMEMEGLLAALNQLEESQREVLALRFLAGLSLQEVADTLDKSVAAVKSIQHRSLKTMKLLMRSKEMETVMRDA
ncbi:MAG: sigma-70 family RNA polymerase sigma factor [Anaerolineae bacterium]|nr:sigma-70 family RNA polymerase sigma factor [Anaerolineae bacterium]